MVEPKKLENIATVVARVRSWGGNQRHDSCETGAITNGPQAAFNIWPICKNGKDIALKFGLDGDVIIIGMIRTSAAIKSVIASNMTQFRNPWCLFNNI